MDLGEQLVDSATFVGERRKEPQVRRPRYCQRFDPETLQLADDVSGWLGESLQEFIEMAIVMRCMDMTCRMEYRDQLGSRSEDLYGIVHQYWENRRRNDKIALSDLPF